MALRLGLGLPSARNSDPYSILGFRPDLVADVPRGAYRVNGAPSTFGSLFTFARSGTATYVDSTGTLQTAADGVARTGHHVWNGSAWVNEGLLHESEARTNLVTYSEDFTDASWVKVNTDTLAVDATGPDGQTSAVTLGDSGATGTGPVYLQTAATVATSTAYTFSCLAKADQLSWVRLISNNFTTPANGGVWFDLANGTVGTEQTGYSGRIEAYGNGWYRCSMTFTTDAADTSGLLFVALADANGSTSVDLDGTSSILIYGAQFEAGSTPSSYIPTTGSTATRNAETLSIASGNLPWPTPNVIGPELVTNGTFVGNDDSDWADITGVWSVTGEALTGTAVPASAYGPYVTNTDVVAGRVYRATFTISVSSGGLYTRVGNAQTPSYTSSGTYSVDLVAITSGVTSFQVRAASSGFTGTIDNISVREIDPLAVTIHLKGRATGGTLTPLRWYADADNAILAQIGTSDFTFTQEAATVVDTVTGGSFGPGINVPFNIASRHGSTFINGAVDGVALTANTTPVALPDLSSTPLEIAQAGGPMIIDTIRVWAADLGDTGIAAASA